jgi:hypothetical protein
MTRFQMTTRQVAAFAEYARDGVEGYEPANDNQTDMMRAAQRRMRREAAEMFARRGAEWQRVAFAAAVQSQR